jgi:DNA-binding transcriptional ArsR family regulator
MQPPTLSTFPRTEATEEPDHDPEDRSRSVEPATLLELLEDDYARRILAAVADDPRPARDLMDACDASRATVYRRLNRLEEADLVAARTTVHPDGHHRKVFEATIEEATIALDGDGVSAEVTVSTRSAGAAPGDLRPVPADD